jgi:hypothetical protein
LGSVDNWTNLSRNVQTFDQSVPIDYSKNYAFQTLATNMRGFTQNIRNGNNFAVINSELRLPVFRYLANRPISSSLLNNFQIVGFFDAGTAWSGLHPWSGENAYDTETFDNGPVQVVIDSNRDPIVFGYGYGVRTRIFGYFLRLDWAYGIENNTLLPRIFYLSLNLDFKTFNYDISSGPYFNYYRFVGRLCWRYIGCWRRHYYGSGNGIFSRNDSA